MSTQNINDFNTDSFLDLLEIIVFRIDSSGRIEAVNQKAGQLARDISVRDSMVRSLFSLDNYSQIVDLAKSNQKKKAEVFLEGRGGKKFVWEFIAVEDGIICCSMDCEQMHRWADKIKNESLILKELLLNILPGSIADELISKKSARPKVYRHSTILFTDVVDFSKIAFHLDPVSLIRKLNSYFSIYDRVMEEYGIEKIKTIGDSYMSVSGLPGKKSSHAVDCCLAALNILHVMEDIKKPERKIDGIDLNNWSVRIGMHSGPCISGVVGYKKYVFDIWGDSVNIAARMEKAGVPGMINISESTYKKVKDFFDCSFRGNQEIKNIGSVKMYFLNRIKPEFSYNGSGFCPNFEFNRHYCERFHVEGLDQDGLPHFIKNFVESKSLINI
jgi:class 3 adenylate cyclase